MVDLLTHGAACISDCETYRYTLSREWSKGPRCVFVMLNPSTADAMQDDPTIRRCIGFAKREGCGALTVVNLFSFRATKPSALRTQVVKNGPDSSQSIRAAIEEADGPVICGWGADSVALGRDRHVIEIIHAAGRSPMCLGKTRTGAPRHPLYVRADAPLVPL